MRQWVHASAIHPLAGGRAEGASPARSRSPYFDCLEQNLLVRGSESDTTKDGFLSKEEQFFGLLKILKFRSTWT